MKKASLVLRGFAAIGVCSLLVLGFQNCAQSNQINPMDLASASPVPGPVVQAYLAADASMPSATWTKIPIGTAEFDTDASLDAANKRISPTKAGYYRVHLNFLLTMTGQAGFTIYGAIYKNGQNYKEILHLINYPSGFNQSLSVDAIVYLNGAGDYVEGYAYSNSGAATLSSGVANTWMSADFIR